MKAKVVSFGIATGLLLGSIVGVSADESRFLEPRPIMRQETPIAANALPEQAGGGHVMKAEIKCPATDDRFLCGVITTPSR